MCRSSLNSVIFHDIGNLIYRRTCLTGDSCQKRFGGETISLHEKQVLVVVNHKLGSPASSARVSVPLEVVCRKETPCYNNLITGYSFFWVLIFLVSHFTEVLWYIVQP